MPTVHRKILQILNIFALVITITFYLAPTSAEELAVINETAIDISKAPPSRGLENIAFSPDHEARPRWYEGSFRTEPKHKETYAENRWDSEGYDREGFDKKGFDRAGTHKDTGTGYDKRAVTTSKASTRRASTGPAPTRTPGDRHRTSL